MLFVGTGKSCFLLSLQSTIVSESDQTKSIDLYASNLGFGQIGFYFNQHPKISQQMHG